MRKILSDVQNEEGKKCLVNTGKNEETLMVPKEKALSGFWCRWRDLNPHGFIRGILSPLCLPIPPHLRTYKILHRLNCEFKHVC